MVGGVISVIKNARGGAEDTCSTAFKEIRGSHINFCRCILGFDRVSFDAMMFSFRVFRDFVVVLLDAAITGLLWDYGIVSC